MMQLSKLVIAGRHLRRLRPLTFRHASRGLASGGRTADPAVFSKQRDRDVQPAVRTGRPEDTADHYMPDNVKREDKEPEYRPEFDPLTPPKPPLSFSTRLQSVGVNNPAHPHLQQKRPYTSAPRKVVGCTDLDFWPSPDKAQQSKAGAAAHEDNKEYFKHHKASPLSEIKLADTRKPMERATDSASVGGGSGQPGVVGWRPEQLVGAEETMMMAGWMFKERVARGDPDTPHGKLLRSLRGESF